MTACVKTFEYGNHTVSIETGVVARQATGSVMVNMDGTVVLVAVVGKKDVDTGRDFFPLTVNYQERMYAAGRIPGGFFKREGRPSEAETLTARLIDRPIRPLFPKGFMNEVQVIATVMSINPEVNPDIPALIGTSAALAVSGLPFEGPIGAARVGYQNGSFMLNPTKTECDNSQLDLVVAGTKTSVLMVESEAEQLPESTMLEAVMFGHQHMQVVIQAIEELKRDAGKPDWTFEAKQTDQQLLHSVSEFAKAGLEAAYQEQDKMVRQTKISEVKAHAIETLVKEEGPTEPQVQEILAKLEKDIVRGWILEGRPRIDGRGTEGIRPISVQTGVLPRTHGSAFFTRGETQAIVVVTLGTAKDAQIIDNATGERRDDFMLHYNFPPYCVGECGMVGSPKRREIGHGKLAKRAIEAVLPHNERFPYVMRAVSEITESNGSSSMASVCGTSLALMDAGVPLKAPVAGIAMGLIKEDDKFAVLSDILGDEDHLGDMDFKVAGTEAGVTALQMDIKINGITQEIMQAALEQAKAGRMHILGIMNEAIKAPRQQLSEFAPRVYSIRVAPEKVRDIIGKGGSTIRALTEATGAIIEVNDEGVVNIIATDGESGIEAQRRIEEITMDIEVNQIYTGKVARIVDFGAFVTLAPGKDGLVHVSQISQERVEDVNAVLSVGQEIQVRVMEIDRQGRIRLTMKDLQPQETEQQAN